MIADAQKRAALRADLEAVAARKPWTASEIALTGIFVAVVVLLLPLALALRLWDTAVAFLRDRFTS